MISLDVRSKLPESDGDSNDDNELNYCKILNKLLPADIQVVSWCPVPEGYSSRFNCIWRTYKYYFIKGKLNIEVSFHYRTFKILLDFTNFKLHQ